MHIKIPSRQYLLLFYSTLINIFFIYPVSLCFATNPSVYPTYCDSCKKCIFVTVSYGEVNPEICRYDSVWINQYGFPQSSGGGCCGPDYCLRIKADVTFYIFESGSWNLYNNEGGYDCGYNVIFKSNSYIFTPSYFYNSGLNQYQNLTLEELNQKYPYGCGFSREKNQGPCQE